MITYCHCHFPKLCFSESQIVKHTPYTFCFADEVSDSNAHFPHPPGKPVNFPVVVPPPTRPIPHWRFHASTAPPSRMPSTQRHRSWKFNHPWTQQICFHRIISQEITCKKTLKNYLWNHHLQEGKSWKSSDLWLNFAIFENKNLNATRT